MQARRLHLSGCRMAAEVESHAPITVAIVAPTLEILGGHSVQARRCSPGGAHDPDVEAWLVPINPAPPAWLRRAARLRYVRTL